MDNGNFAAFDSLGILICTAPAPTPVCGVHMLFNVRLGLSREVCKDHCSTVRFDPNVEINHREEGMTKCGRNKKKYVALHLSEREGCS